MIRVPTLVLFAAAALASHTAQHLAPAFGTTRKFNFAVGSSGRENSARILTWNIDRGTEIREVQNELARERAQLCLLQEVDWNTARTGFRDVGVELARALHMNIVYGVEFEELSQERDKPAYIGQATITSLPIRSSRVLRFEHQSGFWQPRIWLPSKMPLMQRRMGDRIALVAELTFSGSLLVVDNAHLESRSAGHIQSEQLDEMLSDLNRYPPDTPVILGGDLNTKYLPSIFLHKLERAGFRSATGEHIERTHKIAMALDWIFVRGRIAIENGVVEKAAKGSDHYPVTAEIWAR